MTAHETWLYSVIQLIQVFQGNDVDYFCPLVVFAIFTLLHRLIWPSNGMKIHKHYLCILYNSLYILYVPDLHTQHDKEGTENSLEQLLKSGTTLCCVVLGREGVNETGPGFKPNLPGLAVSAGLASNGRTLNQTTSSVWFEISIRPRQYQFPMISE